MRSDRVPRRCLSRILGVALAASMLASCGARAPGLGVPRTEAGPLAGYSIAFARPDGVYLARGDGTDERRLVGPAELEKGETPFLASLDPTGSRVLFLSMSERDPRTGRGRSLSLHVLEIHDRTAAAWHRVRMERLLGGKPDDPVEAAMIPGASWSPDGSGIALGLRRSERGLDDAVVVTDGQGEPRLLLELEGRRLFPGSGLAWARSADAVLVSLDWSSATAPAGVIARVMLDPEARAAHGMAEIGPGRDPAVSPDGTRLAVVDAASSAGDLVLLDMEGKQLDRFERPAGRGLNHLFWSPDGRYLYYYSLASTGPLGIVEIGLLRCLDTHARRVFDLVRLG
jgi:hypothetical protein